MTMQPLGMPLSSFFTAFSSATQLSSSDRIIFAIFSNLISFQILFIISFFFSYVNFFHIISGMLFLELEMILFFDFMAFLPV